jgi:spermidine/putrescine transport system permease protein
MSEAQPTQKANLALAILPSVLLQAAFFVVPLVMTGLLSFQETKSYMLVWSWNLKTWGDVFSNLYYWSIIASTLVMSGITVLLCLLFGFPIAYGLATRFPNAQGNIKILLIFAFLTDSVLKIFGWALFLDHSGVANYLLTAVGLPPLPGWVIFSRAATLLGMVYSLLPFTIFTIFLSVEMLDKSLLRAAYDCGASKWRAFWEVTLPLCKNGLFAGAMLVFVLSLGTFLESKILGGGKTPMVAELIRQTFETRVNWPLGSALTLVTIFITVATILLFSRISDLRAREARK